MALCPITHSGARDAVGESLHLTVSAILKASWPREYSWELKMWAKEGRLVQRQGQAHPFRSKAAACLASIGFGRRLLSNPKAVFNSASFLTHRASLPRTSYWGLFQKDALKASSGGVLALASPSGACEIVFRFYDLIMTNFTSYGSEELFLNEGHLPHI